VYALGIPGKRYHLLYAASSFTLCGFRVRRLEVRDQGKRAELHFVTVIPPDRSLCKHCAQMQQRRKEKSTREDAFR
jgi:hypothetical protein